jgi:hypothetical protein
MRAQRPARSPWTLRRLRRRSTRGPSHGDKNAKTNVVGNAAVPFLQAPSSSSSSSRRIDWNNQLKHMLLAAWRGWRASQRMPRHWHHCCQVTSSHCSNLSKRSDRTRHSNPVQAMRTNSTEPAATAAAQNSRSSGAAKQCALCRVPRCSSGKRSPNPHRRQNGC